MCLFLGLSREVAARFSLMSVPITSAAVALSLAKMPGEGVSAHEARLFLAGSISSAIVGYPAIRFLLNYLATHSLRLFPYYRFASLTSRRLRVFGLSQVSCAYYLSMGYEGLTHMADNYTV
jgi:undecaprenyl pyrophosphate phosphatase UppP